MKTRTMRTISTVRNTAEWNIILKYYICSKHRRDGHRITIAQPTAAVYELFILKGWTFYLSTSCWQGKDQIEWGGLSMQIQLSILIWYTVNICCLQAGRLHKYSRTLEVFRWLLRSGNFTRTNISCFANINKVSMRAVSNIVTALKKTC